jgi:adenylate cyclase
VTASGSTRGTQIAELEAARNERQVIAEGGLAGERRVAWARLVMIALFAVSNQLPRSVTGEDELPLQMAIGSVYTCLAIVAILVLRRIKVAKPRLSLIVPFVVTTGDFAFINAQALADVEFNPQMLGIASAILLSFTVARSSLWHVVYAVALAITGFSINAAQAGVLATKQSAFVLSGFVVLGFMMALTNRAVRVMFRDLRKRDNLTRFLPQPVAERMLRLGPAALAPVQREVTVLFSDIRGFTTMSEGLEPRAVLAVLDDYFGRMSQIVKGHDGVVGKFLGDGLLAFWGVPDRVEDHALRAVRAATDMQRGLVELNRLRAEDGEPPIKIGIGIHTGTVAAGTLGGALQSEYTVIGDAVNVASRIEGLTKDHAVEILISDATWAQLEGAVPGRRLAEETIRGRKEPVVLYTLDEPGSVQAVERDVG